MPLDFRSPDFSQSSRYGEDYVHSSYIPWVIWGLWLWGLRSRSCIRSLTYAGSILFVLSLGPVLIIDGFAFLFADDRGIPLPYFLLEYVWGFSSLSLLYKLSLGPLLMICVHVGRGCSRKQAFAICVLLMVELWLWSPVRSLPQYTNYANTEGLEYLAHAPQGVVLNHPIVGGNPYLYEQMIHKKPMLSSLNFPNSREGKKIWKMLEGGCASVSYREPVYLIVHTQVKHRPQPEDRLVEKALSSCKELFSDSQFVILELSDGQR